MRSFHFGRISIKESSTDLGKRSVLLLALLFVLDKIGM